jgi:GTP pyrophosphokinase
LKKNEAERNKSVEEFMAPIKKTLAENGYKFEITGRSKSIYSIYYKMQHKGVPFEQIYDLTAIRIIFDPELDTPEKKQCWNIYTLITDIYTPKHDRIRDWVSTPKANGYEALHITVMGPDGKWAEVQIRTRRMDDIAEKGFAAHWKYKGVAALESELDRWLRKIKESLEDSHPNALEFLDEFKMNLFASEIQVFTPKGQIKTLPQKATALDFAYEIHSEIGNTAIAAKVNHKLAPLNYELHSGDQVEIITSDKKRSQREWLDKVITAKARNVIRHNVSAETKNNIERGKAMLEEKLKNQNVTLNSRVVHKILNAFGNISKEELYSKIGADLLLLDDLPKILKRGSKNKWIRYWRLQLFGVKDRQTSGSDPSKADLTSNRVSSGNVDEQQLNYRIANCCNPIPGDDVIGCLDTNDLVIIHKVRCPNAVRLTANRSDLIVPVKWTSYKVFSFLAKIALQGVYHQDIYPQIINTMTEKFNFTVRSINMQSHDGVFEGEIELYVRDKIDLEKLIDILKKLTGVEQVNRIETIEN